MCGLCADDVWICMFGFGMVEYRRLVELRGSG